MQSNVLTCRCAKLQLAVCLHVQSCPSSSTTRNTPLACVPSLGRMPSNSHVVWVGQAHRADLMGMQPGSQDSMLNKLKGSLAVRLPDPWGMDFVGTFLSQLSNAVSAAWVRRELGIA